MRAALIGGRGSVRAETLRTVRLRKASLEGPVLPGPIGTRRNASLQGDRPRVSGRSRTFGGRGSTRARSGCYEDDSRWSGSAVAEWDGVEHVPANIRPF